MAGPRFDGSSGGADIVIGINYTLRELAGQLNECNRCSRPLSYRGRCELYDEKSYDVENPPHLHRQPAKAERMRKDERELP